MPANASGSRRTACSSSQARTSARSAISSGLSSKSISPPVWSRTGTGFSSPRDARARPWGGQWREAERGIGQEAALAELERRRDAHQEQLGIDHRGRRVGDPDPYPLGQPERDRPPGAPLQLVDAEKERTDQREVLFVERTDVEGRHVVLVA